MNATIKRASLLLICLAAGYFSRQLVTGDTKRLEQLEAQVKAQQEKEASDQRIGQYAINMMYKSPTTIKELSEARKQSLAQNIVRVANDIFETETEKKAFITALQIESKFLRFAQSPTGPKGLAQVARAAFHEGLTNCGVPEAHDDDAWETDLNLYAGACYFKQMLVLSKGDPFDAIVAYNQGPESEAYKNYSKTGQLNEIEPLKYLARFSYLQRTTTDKKLPNVPAYGEPIPKMTSKTKLNHK